ncbi:SET domain-containing protein [Cohnella pontilimi]|uniref:SET domain-containing protein n=1 Tax=Cohnella pontilimi TaxID=2564100 RepID=A0A4V5LSD0_9BACL|nr:SET domain-containing protein [Cohnella pontilimi]TJY42599.1 SET domain-containing protein [Cohnella pontilimi]
MVKVEESPGKGRGVFAARDIEKGEIIERSPVIVIPKEQRGLIRKTVLRRYVFRWGATMRDYAIALGVGSLFNHSYNPKAVYRNNHEEMCMEFEALVDIPEGTEITVNYNRDPNSNKPLPYDVID